MAVSRAFLVLLMFVRRWSIHVIRLATAISSAAYAATTAAPLLCCFIRARLLGRFA
jgi:hypothetical protein